MVWLWVMGWFYNDLNWLWDYLTLGGIWEEFGRNLGGIWNGNFLNAASIGLKNVWSCFFLWLTRGYIVRKFLIFNFYVFVVSIPTLKIFHFCNDVQWVHIISELFYMLEIKVFVVFRPTLIRCVGYDIFFSGISEKTCKDYSLAFPH